MQHTPRQGGPRQGGGTITWGKEDFAAGLGPQGAFSGAGNLMQVERTGFLTLSRIDPFVIYGALSPGYGPGTNATNSSSLAGTLVAMELSNNSVGLAVDAGGKIQSITLLTNTIAVAGGFPHTIAFAAGSTYVAQDGILYRHNSGGTAPANSVTSFFYSAYNSNNWNVGAYVNLATFDDVFMSGTPATPMVIVGATSDGIDTTQRTAPHPMEIGADGILYIGSGRYLHAYNGNTGNNGTFTTKVLTLPQGFQIVALKKYQDIFLIVGNYYSTDPLTSIGEAQLYVWNYLSADISSVVPLEDFYVSALFLWNGSPAVITQGVPARNGKNKVKVITGNQVTTIADFDGIIPINRGVVVLDDIIYMNAGGKILSVGNKYRKSYAVNHLHTLSGAGTSGVLNYSSIISGFTASSSDGTPCLNNIISTTGMGGANAKTFFFAPPFPYNKIGRVKSVIVEYYQELVSAGSNGTFTLQLNTDNSNTQYLIVNAKSDVALPLIKRYTQTTAEGKLPLFSSLGFSATWITSTAGTSPTITKIEVDYELEEVPLTI